MLVHFEKLRSSVLLKSVAATPSSCQEVNERNERKKEENIWAKVHRFECKNNKIKRDFEKLYM